MVLSLGCGATVQQANLWQSSNGLTYPILSDPDSSVTLQYTNFFGLPVVPWDAILTTDQVVAFTGNSYSGQVWQIEEIEAILDSLFDPQIAADPEELDFGLVSPPAQLSLVLDNAGTGRLDILDISSGTPDFTPDVTQGQIYAVDDSLVVTVTFSALPAGEYRDTLTITADEQTLQIPMSAEIPDAVEPNPSLPQAFAVHCFPNPFNAELTVQIELQKPQQIQAEIFRISGEKQRGIFQGPMGVGQHHLRWSDDAAPSGIYLVQISGDDWKEIRKVVLLR